MPLPLVTLNGRMVADPELRFAPSGVAVASFTVACSQQKQVNGEWVDDKVHFQPCTAFKSTAENLVESFRRGDSVLVTGRLNTESWTTEGGDKRSMAKVLVDEVGVPVRFRTVPHGAGRAERSSGGGTDEYSTGGGQPSSGQQSSSPAATTDSDEPPF